MEAHDVVRWPSRKSSKSSCEKHSHFQHFFPSHRLFSFKRKIDWKALTSRKKTNRPHAATIKFKHVRRIQHIQQVTGKSRRLRLVLTNYSAATSCWNKQPERRIHCIDQVYEKVWPEIWCQEHWESSKGMVKAQPDESEYGCVNPPFGSISTLKTLETWADPQFQRVRRIIISWRPPPKGSSHSFEPTKYTCPDMHKNRKCIYDKINKFLVIFFCKTWRINRHNSQRRYGSHL